MTQRESKERWIQIYTLALTAHWRSRFVARPTVEVFRLYNCTPPCTVLGGGFSWCAVMREGSRQNESKVQITPSLTSPRCLAFPLGGQKYCRAKSLRPMMMESYPISGTMQNWIAIKQFAHFTGRSVIESVTENLATVPVCFVCVCWQKSVVRIRSKGFCGDAGKGSQSMSCTRTRHTSSVCEVMSWTAHGLCKSKCWKGRRRKIIGSVRLVRLMRTGYRCTRCHITVRAQLGT